MSEANAAQRTHWNEVSGPKWVSLSDTVNAQIEPLGLAAIDTANIAPGNAVLDLGCGCGQTTIELASRTGAKGRVQGVDISAPMLADARARVSRAGIDTINLIEADVQTHAFEPDVYDVAFSRFGVMFFDDPVAAFRNVASAVKPGGSLCFICWQAVSSNPWMMLPALSAAKHVEMPSPAGGANAPGPFAFADAKRVSAILEEAGWSDIDCHDHSGELSVGRGQPLEEIIDFLQQMGPAGAALREATEAMRAKVTETMKEDLAPYYTGDALSLGFATWIVTARS